MGGHFGAPHLYCPRPTPRARRAPPPGGHSLVDAHRLPRTVVPRRYDLRLDPDLLTLTFTGEAAIAVTVTEPVREIVLNAAELAITEVRVAAGGRTIAGRATIEPEHERARLALDDTM